MPTTTKTEWKDAYVPNHDYRTGNINVNADTTKGLSTTDENKAG